MLESKLSLCAVSTFQPDGGEQGGEQGSICVEIAGGFGLLVHVAAGADERGCWCAWLRMGASILMGGSVAAYNDPYLSRSPLC